MDHEIICDKCKSTNIIVKKRGISVSSAIGGSLVFGPLGTLAGLIGKNDIVLQCLNCGYKWEPKPPDYNEWPDYEEE